MKWRNGTLLRGGRCAPGGQAHRGTGSGTQHPVAGLRGGSELAEAAPHRPFTHFLAQELAGCPAGLSAVQMGHSSPPSDIATSREKNRARGQPCVSEEAGGDSGACGADLAGIGGFKEVSQGVAQGRGRWQAGACGAAPARGEGRFPGAPGRAQAPQGLALEEVTLWISPLHRVDSSAPETGWQARPGHRH